MASPDTAWSEAHNATQTNLLWSVGLTPFGPYSRRLRLSFAHRDAAARAVLHAMASEVLGELAELRGHFAEFGKEVDDVLSSADHLPFLRRLNVLTYKLQVRRV